MNVNEKYFRPSKSPALNTINLQQSGSPIQLQQLIKSPYETAIHFSVLFVKQKIWCLEKWAGADR